VSDLHWVMVILRNSQLVWENWISFAMMLRIGIFLTNRQFYYSGDVLVPDQWISFFQFLAKFEPCDSMFYSDYIPNCKNCCCINTDPRMYNKFVCLC
jgi:hypothetical protein